METKIWGASDDLVEVTGHVREEFSWIANDDEGAYMACSDGTLLRLTYDAEGCWRISPVIFGRGNPRRVAEGSPDAGEREDGTSGYSDVWAVDDLEWVAFASAWARASA